jgi:hypothetical protein
MLKVWFQLVEGQVSFQLFTCLNLLCGLNILYVVLKSLSIHNHFIGFSILLTVEPLIDRLDIIFMYEWLVLFIFF